MKNDTDYADCNDDDNNNVDIECAIPLIKENDNAWVVHAERVKSLADWSRRTAVFIFALISLVMCLFFYMTCQQCLFCVLIISACLCPWFNVMNAPLWTSIVLLILGGWTFTTGYLSVTWNSGVHV